MAEHSVDGVIINIFVLELEVLFWSNPRDRNLSCHPETRRSHLGDGELRHGFFFIWKFASSDQLSGICCNLYCDRVLPVPLWLSLLILCLHWFIHLPFLILLFTSSSESWNFVASSYFLSYLGTGASANQPWAELFSFKNNNKKIHLDSEEDNFL